MATTTTYVCDIFDVEGEGVTVTSAYHRTPREAMRWACMGVSDGGTRRMLLERLESSPLADTPAKLHAAIRQAFDLRFSRYEGGKVTGAIACIA